MFVPNGLLRSLSNHIFLFYDFLFTECVWVRARELNEENEGIWKIEIK